ncbi:mitochondrial fission factor-like isoform X2 [Heteronotia binoei]|uniref:mitochondrial fission factor-like isoform X2 n=1 Tax=Heteronotia binoei TaxID=13085 RepID=UPI002931B582|nr:mitochondrial fission factor-like isoform X2 [Heteronotia binoei]
MWPIWGVPNRADLDFTETINKRMRVPNRLKAADESSLKYPKRAPSEDFPSPFQMYVPDRLLPAETRDIPFRPALVNQIRQHCLAVADPLLEPSGPTTIHEEHPILSLVSRPGSQKRKRLSHQGRARKERILSETSQLALCGVRQRRECAPETSVILESSLEEIGTAEILAMRKQLAKISGRLRSLEEKYMGWRQKELVVYSVLVSTYLLNMWLWMRR